jgi:hypothetical protein
MVAGGVKCDLTPETAVARQCATAFTRREFEDSLASVNAGRRPRDGIMRL